MTAQLWKTRGAWEARVTFRCPWCDVVGTAPVRGHHQARRDFWLLAGCPEPACGRGVLIRVPAREVAGWLDLDTGDRGLLLDRTCVHPGAQFADAHDGAS